MGDAIIARARCRWSLFCRLVLVAIRAALTRKKKFCHRQPPAATSSILSQERPRAGEDVTINVRADGDTRRIAARIFGAQPVPVVWDAASKVNLGHLRIPAGLPSGAYTIQITAEDFAHNSSVTEVMLQVIGNN